MSGDGPLSIERNATSDADGPLHKIHYGTEYGWLTDDEVDAVADQLNRARRCAEAETNLLSCSLALSSMEDERDDARAERDAALAERDRWLREAERLKVMVDDLESEVRRPLAARPDLTALRRHVQRYRDALTAADVVVVEHDIVKEALRLAEAADPAPAPDTVTITDCDPQCCQDWPNGHAYDCPQVTAARAAPEADR